MNAMRILAVGVAMLASAGIGIGSRVPYSAPGSETSVVRLSWRLRGEKKEECRARTPEELAALPVHMRTPEVCTGKLVSYRMTLRIDDAPPVVRVFLPAGAKGDRPIFVMHEQPVAPGEHVIDVRFEPEDTDEAEHEDDADDDDDDDDDDDHREPLRLRSRVDVRPGQVVLIKLSDDAKTLELKR